MKPLITTLIDTYNYGRYVEDAIESVLTQDFPMERVEVLVVDDGSTDDTAERVKKYGERIRYFRKENGGQASAFNYGFARARGKIIALLDADDYFLQGKLRRVVEEFQKHREAGMLYHRLAVLNEVSGKKEGQEFVAVSGFLPDDVSKLLAYDQYPTSSHVYRRRVLERILPIPEGLRLQADTYMSFLAPLITPVIGVDGALGVYRVHRENLYCDKERHSTPEQIERRFAMVRAVEAETKSWIRHHKGEVKQPVTRMYFAWCFQGAERQQFVFAPPRRWKLFLSLLRYQWAFRSQQSWRFAIYNYVMAVEALVFGYKNHNAASEWQERVLRKLQASRARIFGSGKA